MDRWTFVIGGVLLILLLAALTQPKDPQLHDPGWSRLEIVEHCGRQFSDTTRAAAVSTARAARLRRDSLREEKAALEKSST